MMAIFGVYGYLKGLRWALYALLLLLVAFILVEKKPGTIASTINGLYLGVMLTLKGGLAAIASGDLDSAAALLESTTRPVTDQNRQMVMVMVIVLVMAMGLVLSLILKSKASPLGLLFGLLYGYMLSATVLPLMFPGAAPDLPIPFLRAATDSPTAACDTGCGGVTTAAPSLFTRVFTTLGEPQSIRLLAILLGVLIVLILLYSVRNSAKSGSKKKG